MLTVLKYDPFSEYSRGYLSASQPASIISGLQQVDNEVYVSTTFLVQLLNILAFLMVFHNNVNRI